MRSSVVLACRLPRRTLATVLAGAVVLAAASPLASADARSKSACEQLRGKDLAAARTIKLVKRYAGDASQLLGCALPRGRVRTLASSSGGGGLGAGFSVRQVQGAFVLLRAGYGSSNVHEEWTGVVNIRTGRGYRISYLREETGSSVDRDAHATTSAAFITPRGDAAAVIDVTPLTNEAPASVVAAFSPSGRRTELDSGSPAEIQAGSLALRGRTVTWTHAGQPRRATLQDTADGTPVARTLPTVTRGVPKARTKPACGALHHDRAPQRELKVVVVGRVETEQDLRACVTPRGKVHTIARWWGYYSGRYLTSAGTFLLYREGESNQYAFSDALIRVAVGRTGVRRAVLAKQDCAITGPFPCPGRSYGLFALHRSGATAVVRTDTVTNDASLDAISPRGAWTKLDDGAGVTGLRVQGNEFVWTRDGTEHRAPVPR